MKISKRFSKVLLIGLITLSFLFFFYYSFPLNVLKQKIYRQLNTELGLEVSIGDLRTTLPFGVSAQSVHIKDPSIQQNILINYVDVSIGILDLLTGSLNVTLILSDDKDGELDLEVDIPFSELTTNSPLPKFIYIDAYSYNYGPLVNFALTREARSPTANPIAASFLGKIKLTGKLKGKTEIELNKNNLSQSKGKLFFTLVDSTLNFTGSDLGIRNQQFSKGILKGSVLGGALNISEESGLKSEDMELNFNGNINLSNQILQSTLDLRLDLFLFKDLYKNFGHMVSRDDTNNRGVLQIEIAGNLSQPFINKKDL